MQNVPILSDSVYHIFLLFLQCHSTVKVILKLHTVQQRKYSLTLVFPEASCYHLDRNGPLMLQKWTYTTLKICNIHTLNMPQSSKK